MRIALCIATFKRPDGLRRLLAALGDQRLSADAFALEVVVVDNDGEGSARAAFDEATKSLPWMCTYRVEKAQGISFARNTAVAAASDGADWIAFLDDDEVPDPGWLDALTRGQREHGADVVTGPVLPHFPEPVEPWLSEGRFFLRRRYATGAVRPHAFTNNVLLRRSLFREAGLAFDERFALTGGSDRHFFRRAARRGYRIVWADDAVVHEWIPPSRATPAWLVRRAYRVGTTTALVDMDITPTVRMRGLLAAKGVAWLVIGVGQYVAGFVRGRAGRLRGKRSAAYGAGLLAGLVGGRYEEYRTPHPV